MITPQMIVETMPHLIPHIHAVTAIATKKSVELIGRSTKSHRASVKPSAIAINANVVSARRQKLLFKKLQSRFKVVIGSEDILSSSAAIPGEEVYCGGNWLQGNSILFFAGWLLLIRMKSIADPRLGQQELRTGRIGLDLFSQ